MFVVHDITGGRCTTRDYGNVAQFFRHKPVFRQAKDEEIFKECVKQGFIYTSEYFVNVENERRWIITYNKSLIELQDEVVYNRNTNNGRTIK